MKRRKPVIQTRSILVYLPEDKMLALVKRAKEGGVSTHALAADAILDWLGRV